MGRNEKIEKPSTPRLSLSNRCERLIFRRQEVRFFFDSLAATGRCSLDGELSVVFLNDLEMAALHERFLNDSSPTDVLTFPGDERDDFAGEICVSAERAWIESRDRGIAFSREVCLYLVHGWLHLAGYDDHTAADRHLMRQAEKEVLSWAEAEACLPVFSYK